MLSTKGQSKHRACGRFFFYAMTGIFVTAIPLALAKNNFFLFLIAIFSYYLALTGWRYANNRSGLPTTFDWVVSIVMVSASLMMIGAGIFRFSLIDTKSILLLIFGSIGTIFSVSDLRSDFNHSAHGKIRIAKHLSAMLGATIAALTAFSVTNIHIKPSIVLWLGPTVLLVPVIAWWKQRVLAGKINIGE